MGNLVEIKPLGGIAGDMFVGACAALWPHLKADCLKDVRDAGVPEAVSVGFENVSVNGFASESFLVSQGDEAPKTGVYTKIVAGLEASTLDRAVLTEALGILRILGEAEATAHGKPIETVHFHELADWDSITDIVAAASFIARTPDTRWTVGVLPLGGGHVMTQHGRIPVPAPAVLNILEGYEFQDDGQNGERITPTGAAILHYLTTPGETCAGGQLAGMGFGAGTKRFKGLANVVQLVAFESADAADGDQITEIAFDIDDMTPEELGVASDRLRAALGVLDVIQTAQIGKKGRAIIGVRVLCARAAGAEVADLCLSETSTLGVRVTDIRRRILDRHAAATRHGAVKVAERPDGARSAKVESDDLIETQTLIARRAQARVAEAAALEGDDD